MPYNGSGTFSPYTPGNPRVAGTTIAVAAINNTNTDFATGLTNAVTRDGQGTMAANFLPSASATYDLGNSTYEWKSLTTSGAISSGTSFVYQGASFATTVTAAPTANRALVLPDVSGTLAITMPSRFYAAASANQVGVVSGATTQVSFGTQSYDIGGEYAADTFTPTVTGIYLFTAGVVLATNLTIGTNAQMWFAVNGTATAGAKMNVGGTTTPILNLTWVGSVTAAQTVIVNFLHNLGSNVTISSGGSAGITFFSGIRLI